MHNVEHGAVIFLYQPTLPAQTVAALRDVFTALPVDPKCGHSRALMTADAELPTPFALVAAAHVLESDCIVEQAFLDFVQQQRGLGPEDVCIDGAYP